MDLLKAEIAKKRQRLEEDTGGKRFFKRSEIEQKQIQKLREQEKRESSPDLHAPALAASHFSNFISFAASVKSSKSLGRMIVKVPNFLDPKHWGKVQSSQWLQQPWIFEEVAMGRPWTSRDERANISSSKVKSPENDPGSMLVGNLEWSCSKDKVTSANLLRRAIKEPIASFAMEAAAIRLPRKPHQYRRLTHFEVNTFVEEVPMKDGEWLPRTPATLKGSYVFVCPHGFPHDTYGHLFLE